MAPPPAAVTQLLMTPLLTRMFYMIDDCGMSWGDFDWQERQTELAAETPAQRAKREAEAAAHDKAQQADFMAARQNAYARDVQIKTTGLRKNAEVKKVVQPCKWLYAVQGCDGKFSNSPCAECWAHEYTDAKGVHHVKHTCPYIHQDEPGWLPEWNSLPVTRERFRIVAPVILAGRDMGGLKVRGPVTASAAAPSTTVYYSSAPRQCVTHVARPTEDMSAW